MTRKGLTAAGAGLLALAACGERAGDSALVDLDDADASQVIRLDGAGPTAGGDAPAFSDKVEVVDGRGLYTANRNGQIFRIPFALATDRVDAARGHLFAPVGETEDGVVAIVDDYATRSAQGKTRCQDGTETFVRVFSLSRARELLAIPVGSCLDGIKTPQREATWLPPNRIRIETTPARVYELSDTKGAELVRAE